MEEWTLKGTKSCLELFLWLFPFNTGRILLIIIKSS